MSEAEGRVSRLGRCEDCAGRCGSSVFGNSAVLLAVADSQWHIYSAVLFAVADSQWHLYSAVLFVVAEAVLFAVTEPTLLTATEPTLLTQTPTPQPHPRLRNA